MPRSSAKLISDLYQRALAVPAPERAAFLDRECSSDSALRDEVASLLRFEPASERFLETPAVAAAATGARMIGRTLGSYTLTAPLGVGGMGEVYRARDSKLGRDVAIKILSSATPPRCKNANVAVRMLEARAASALNHPNIVTLYDMNAHDWASISLVMEYVEGESLAERWRGGAADGRAWTWPGKIILALEAAHAAGIIHRDLKPAQYQADLAARES